MKLLDVLRKVNNRLSNKVVSEKTLRYQEQYDYLNSLPEPKDDIERSYNQYLCQAFSSENKLSLFIKNAASAIMLPVYYHKKYRQEEKKPDLDKPVIYIMVNNKTDMLPDEFHNSDKLVGVPYGDGFFLDDEDIAFIRMVKRKYPYSYYFVYKVLLKIGLYSSIVRRYEPKAIVVNAETSYTSSILTYYCENKGIQHIDVMHGEKVFWIRDSFFRFTKCYVWSDYHVELFKSLRAVASEYIVSLPPAMRFDVSQYQVDQNKVVDYKFYLGYENQKTIGVLRNVADKLTKKEKTFMLRPHPIYTDINLLRRWFSLDEIEDTNTVGIEESIMSTKNVVSIFSTVLRQAYYAGVRVVVDNCSNIEKYEEMKDLKFWLYQTDHTLLSDEIETL